MKIENAIIILGPGKSGTTLLNDILALHPDLFWISTYLNKYPKYPWLSILNNFQAINSLEKYTRYKSKFPRPAESFPFWSHYIPDFRFNPKNFNSREVKAAQKAIRVTGRFQKGFRFITKLTGPSRWRFLEEIFADPYIIWLDRDPKAVIASFYSYKWNYKDDPEAYLNKGKNELIKEYSSYYNKLQKNKENLKRFKYMEVYYEDLVENPELFFKDICEFLDLKFHKGFRRKVGSWGIRKNTNTKYREIFTSEEIQLIEAHLEK